ncbi:MAG: HAD family hydrolase [Anaerolineae bacterium]|nr:HAD family hydrolase [Anaerolineae bacterium]
MTTQTQIPFEHIRAWFFDLDGTLMDTDDQAVENLAHRLRFLGIVRAQRLARRLIMFSETPMNNMLTMLDRVGLDAVLFTLRSMLQGEVHPTFRMIQNVKPLLLHLAQQAPLAVVSTRAEEAAQEFLRQHDLTNLFQLIVTQASTYRLKPHPEPVLFAAQQLGIPPAACVMVGDTPVDVLSGRRAGAWTVGVLCGFGEEAELRRAGAHLVLPSTADLLPLLQNKIPL